MKLLVALGGNALLRRGQALSLENQLANIGVAAAQLAQVASDHQLVVTHGNGPQVGLLALQEMAYDEHAVYPLDVIGAQTDGMIGYLLEQALGNLLPATRTIATLLTRVEVDRDDPAFTHPSKPVGPVYSAAEAGRIAAAYHWAMGPDGAGMRRMVASPQPLRVLGLDAIGHLLAHGTLVIAAGGGGIPVARDKATNSLLGVDAVIDKDFCSALLARALEVDCFVVATDVASVFLDWGSAQQRPLRKTTPRQLAQYSFANGSMGPKVLAACDFVERTGRRAVIGAIGQIEAMLAGEAGTEVGPD
ncbi:carbamate kinase [Massilia sp. S19_KUP03_FR1]|uniref:carbamate kinase n=1 Tax=Massilia sp. S19_KUP03_FR1 TaxID=3025503 RepID=UPI002FCD705C